VLDKCPSPSRSHSDLSSFGPLSPILKCSHCDGVMMNCIAWWWWWGLKIKGMVAAAEKAFDKAALCLGDTRGCVPGNLSRVPLGLSNPGCLGEHPGVLT
jgi:hypothetical protein